MRLQASYSNDLCRYRWGQLLQIPPCFQRYERAKRFCASRWQWPVYDPGVIVRWNPKAYGNAQVMNRGLKDQYKYAAQGFVTPTTRRFLSLGVFAGQKTKEVMFNPLTVFVRIIMQVKTPFLDLSITTSFIPSGCTGYIQALDVAINKPLKDRIGDLADDDDDDSYTYASPT